VGNFQQPDKAVANADNNRTNGLERINQQLQQQLTIANKTIEEISHEYSQVFGGTQTALALDNSSKKVLTAFQAAEQAVKQSIADLQVSTS